MLALRVKLFNRLFEAAGMETACVELPRVIGISDCQYFASAVRRRVVDSS